MNNYLQLFASVAIAVSTLTACHKNDHDNGGTAPVVVHPDPGPTLPPAKETVVLLLNTDGGEDAIGQWISSDTKLSSFSTIYESTGTSLIDPTAVTGTNSETGARAGFYFNPVDGYFYGVLPAYDNIGIDPFVNSTHSFGSVIRFNPNTDEIQHVATIPKLFPFDATTPYSDYLTSPVISPDGKSLLLVAQHGGPVVPSSSGNQDSTIGGVVHLNIDGDSETYGKFTPVYGFHEHGVGLTWQQQLDVVRTQPLLAETSAGQVLFLVTDTSYDHFGGNEVNPSEAISLVPSDIDDWSKPWQMIGAPGSGGIGKPAQNIWYDSHNDELWFAMELSPTDFLEDSVVFKRKGPTGKVESNNIFIPKEYWVTSPQAIFSQAGKTYLFTAGYRSGCPTPFQCIGKILQVGLNNQATIRETFSSYDVSPTAWLLAGGLSSSLSTGYHYLNAVPNMDEKNFRTSLAIAKDNLRDVDNPLEDPLLTKSLDELYSDFDILPSQMDRYDFQNFGRINLFKGSTESGYTLIGSPAIGGLKSEPLTDRFIVSLAITGGTHGAGAIIKHDRFNNTTTSIPLVTRMPIAPAGQAIQLENGTMLGGTLKLSHSGLAPQKPDVGVWIKANDAASIVEYELPSTTGRCGSSSQCLIDALYAPKTFVKAATGDIWSAVSYQVFDIGIDFSCFLIGKACTRETMALVKFDAETGKPTGDIHILADSPTLVGNYFTEASIAQNILTYVTPALRNDPVTIGERLWIADVSAEAKPEFNMVMLSPEGGELNTAWSTPFAPTAQKATGHFYFMTLATSAGEEVRVHRMELGDIVTDKPSLMTVISGETKIPSTPLFEGSDGMFYYGTRDGALMQFNPEELIVRQVADLVETGMTSDARGFISELSEGVISGIVVDSSASESEVATRAYMYDLETQIIKFVDVSDRISVRDTFPGLLPITREVAN